METLETIKTQLTATVISITQHLMYGIDCDLECLMDDADRLYKYQLMFESDCAILTPTVINCLIDNKT
jgi:hypothetical protein